MLTIAINKAYKPAKLSKNRYRVLYGGSGSGKSHYMGQETILSMLSSGEYSYLVARKTNRSIRHSVFLLLTSLISEYNLAEYFTVNKSDMSITCATGSRLVTSGLDDVEKLKSIAGINRIWIEEASEITQGDYTQLDLRMRGNSPVGHQMTLTFNPISELHWLKRHFFDAKQPDTFLLKTTYKDNSHIDQAYKERLERLQEEDYQYYRIYTLGEWGSLGNLIFTNWERADLSQQKKSFDNFYNGVDFGFADDPFAFVRVHHDSMRKVIYITDEIYRRALHNDEAAPLIIELAGREIVTCDSAEPKSIDDLRRHGVKARAARKGPGSVGYGIKWLQGQKVVIDENCTYAIKEISGYKWREDKDGNVIPKPIDINNHLIDALRYALESAMVDRRARVAQPLY